jgi:transposase
MNHTMKRLSVGVDVSEKTLDVAYWDQDENEPVFVGTFTNNCKGFQSIQRKIEERSMNIDATVIHLVMEPSGGYEQPFAHFAHQAGWKVSLPNPLYPKRWAESKGKRAKTDPQDARNLAHFALVNDPLPWKPLPPEVEQLSHLLDRMDALKKMLSQEKNRVHLAEYHVNGYGAVYDDIKEVIAFLEQRIQQLKKVIKEHLEAHPHLKKQRKLLLTVSGVGDKNVLYILVMMHRWGVLTDGEGDAKGLVAYLGLDPKPHESGTSVRKRSGISRQGNRDMRSRLYMSALGGIKGKNSPLTAFYQRLVMERGKPKKLALVAASRKILVWSWAVFRSDMPFDTARLGYNQ